MTSQKGRRRPKIETGSGSRNRPKPVHLPPPSSTGAEAGYLRSLVDSRRGVTVTLKTGEQLRGRIRYYDRDFFSLRLAEGGEKLFLPKSSVLGIEED